MSGDIFLKIEKYWSTQDRNYFYALIIMFEVIPKVLIALIFLVEVTFMGQIKLFIYSINLILIVILWHIFLKLFASCGERNLPIIKEYFVSITGVGDPILDEQGNIISYHNWEFIIKPEYEEVIDIKEETTLLFQLEAMPRFVEQIKKDTAKIIPYLTLSTSFIFIIGGLYRLVFFLS